MKAAFHGGAWPYGPRPQPLSGAMPGRLPCGPWLSAMSSTHYGSSRRMSYSSCSVSAISIASPVQPFFSYIGVSVGMPW